MNGIIALFIAALFIGIVTLLVAMIARFLGRFNEETRRIADKMRGSQDSDEYIYWQSRLRRHYIRLLPFISEKTAGRICSRLFRKPKHSAEKCAGEEHGDGLFHILAPSVLSLCLCAVCLCGMSWAWFTASTSSAVTTIQAANYAVGVTVTEKDSKGADVDVDGIQTTNEDGVTIVSFENNGSYTVTLTATGSASQGYFLVTIGNTPYITDGKVGKDESVRFNVNAGAKSSLTVTPVWIAENKELPTTSTDSVEYKKLSSTALYTVGDYVDESVPAAMFVGEEETDGSI